jgi:nucleoside-diphosphate-sugar epimerase
MIELQGRRIALIGGAGFIGHHLAIALTRSGAKVSVIDNLQVNNLLSFSNFGADNPNRDFNLSLINERLEMMRQAGVDLYVQDARDYIALGRLLNGHIEPQVVIHLAAIAHAGRSNKDPWSTFDHSTRTLENALDCSRDTTVEQFIYFSSSMVYGHFLIEEVDEDHSLNPVGIYGALKVGGEKIVIAYQQVFDLPYTIIRPSALYGPRCVSRRVGQIFIENALNGKALRVEGDGSDRLDFTYIDDLVEGVQLAIQNPASRNQIFNLTYGRSSSIQEMLDIVLEEFPEARVEHTQRNALMPIRGTLSIKKAQELLGYEPSHPIERGLIEYIEWYRGLNQSTSSLVNA